jgi:Fe-S cluster biogenesis protein NfuA
MTGAAPQRPITQGAAQAVLDEWVRPAIASHAGDVNVVEVSPEGDVRVEFTGACRTCPLQPVTLGTAVMPAFEGIEGVREVTCRSVRVSRHAMRRMTKLMAPTVVRRRRGA